jgi:hypothetical protein
MDADVDPTQYKKDELVAAADMQGVEVEKGDTKADIAKKLSTAPGVAPVIVSNFTRRGDNDALLGGWVDIVSGPYQGRFGSYRDTAQVGSDGYPSEIYVRTRDQHNELLVVAYSDVRPSERTGGR